MTTTRIASFCFSLGLFLILILSACNNSTDSGQETDPELAVEKATTNPFVKFIGKWADMSGDNEFYELWEKKEKGLEGTGLVLSEGDTVFIEHLEVFMKNDEWFYSARIDGQNRGDAIEFRNTMAKDSLFVFENPDHDFPQSISYQFLPNGGIQIFTRGVEDGEVRTEEFNMSPVDPSGEQPS